MLIQRAYLSIVIKKLKIASRFLVYPLLENRFTRNNPIKPPINPKKSTGIPRLISCHIDFSSATFTLSKGRICRTFVRVAMIPSGSVKY